MLLNIVCHPSNKSICPTFSFWHEQPTMRVSTCMILNSKYWSFELIKINHRKNRQRVFLISNVTIYFCSIFRPTPYKEAVFVLVELFLTMTVQFHIIVQFTKNIQTHEMNNSICSGTRHSVQWGGNFIFQHMIQFEKIKHCT